MSACSQTNNSGEAREMPYKTKFDLIESQKVEAYLNADKQIADFVRNIYQDKNENFWMGTNGRGIAHYNGDSLAYFSNKNGFDGQQVTGITEDQEKNIWFATDQGIVKYAWESDEKGSNQFINYSADRYFKKKRFWSICADSQGNIWGGSVEGVFKFDGKDWESFEIPYPEPVSGNFITDATSCSIIEDSKGNIWIGTNGFGAYKYDGTSFTQYTKKGGLSDDSVDIIMEDKNHNIWIGTRFGGVCRYDGKTFTNYSLSEGSIGNDEVCIIYEDSQGNIWMSSEGFGVYRFDGKDFTNYGEREGLGVKAVQDVFEDRDGRIWVGGGGGLYRMEGERFVHVKKEGPWR